ncbi:MAG: hypothetical protein ACRD13_14770 [Terriglobales bacterium]
MLKAGDAAVLPQPGNQTPHLWFALSDADQGGYAVIVNVTTLRPRADRTVILSPGDHPFIRHDSVASFQDARIANVALLEQKIGELAGAHRERSCSAELLARLIRGALESPHTKRKIKEKLRLAPGGAAPAARGQ